MNKNLTVVYITNNTEDKSFESKIIKNLREVTTDLPIISVSRVPIKLGKNICVGEVPVCDSTDKRMLLKGLHEAETEYVIIAHPTFLYPPEYFSFTPPVTADNTVYYYGNVWTLGSKFWKIKLSENAEMCNRYFWIKMLTKALSGHKGWKPFTVPAVFPDGDTTSFTSENPVIKLITANTANKYANIDKSVLPKGGFPLWGTAAELKTKMEI
jgi:hypothetical protein